MPPKKSKAKDSVKDAVSELSKSKVKKPTSAGSRPGSSKSPTILTEDVISTTDIGTLIDLVNENVHTNADIIHNKYKDLAEEQMSQDHLLIQELREENERLTQRLSESSSNAEFTSPIRKKKIKQDDFEKEREHICFTLDLLELLTGIKVTNFEESPTRYTFDIKQTSSNKELFIEYSLILSKVDSSQINYVPTFLEDDGTRDSAYKANQKNLVKVLPDYLCEYLSFPFNTLAQFYGKVNKALNRK
ncbi:csm1-like protein [Lodderomyces elongisporus]|uniref:csm1-like protein n=1 Tax=Lodderomyces elongisporus TaxID=36914 RepID=UPI0029236326|nr:csm1-like protein [Lodderomyces elongisporus]WLF78584.1 csm1-like protein [Lodderomyces elongisporus]